MNCFSSGAIVRTGGSQPCIGGATSAKYSIRANRDHFKKNRAYEIAQKLKMQGKIKYVGFSYHDNAEYLEQLLNEHMCTIKIGFLQTYIK